MDEPDLTRRAVLVDAWDVARCDDMAEAVPEFAGEGLGFAAFVGDGGAELWADLFALLDQPDPRLNAPAAMVPALRANVFVMATAQRLPEVGRLRVWTDGDPVAAALACASLRDALETIYDRAQVLRRLLQQAAELQERLGSLVGEEVSDQNAVAEAAEDLAGAQAEAEAEEQAQEGERFLVLRAAVTRAAEAAEDLARRLSVLGGRDQLVRLSAERRLALARRMSTPAFAALADLLGAMSRLLDAAMHERVLDVPDELGDLEHGSDISRLSPTSLLALATPGMEDQFFADMVEGRLTVIGRRGASELARGGVVCCVDNSISMAGDPECFAKAVGLALLNLCRRQQRRFHGLHFAARYPRGHLLAGQPQLLEFDFSGPHEVERVLDFAEFFFGGWTDFTIPLGRGLEILEAEHAETGAVGSDIVMVTDGEASVTTGWAAGWLERMAAVGGRAWTLLIGEDPQAEPLATLCQGRVARITDVLRPGANVRDLFADVGWPQERPRVSHFER